MTTPEAAAYEQSVDEVRRWNARIWRFIAIACLCFLFAMSGVLAYVVNSVSEIRTTQLSNTRAAQCQDKAFDAILRDVRLAFTGDKNSADYSQAPKQC